MISSSHRPLPGNTQHSRQQQQKIHTPTRFEPKSYDCTSERPQTNVLDRSAIAIVKWFSIYMRSGVLLGVLSLYSCLNWGLVISFSPASFGFCFVFSRLNLTVLHNV